MAFEQAVLSAAPFIDTSAALEESYTLLTGTVEDRAKPLLRQGSMTVALAEGRRDCVTLSLALSPPKPRYECVYSVYESPERDTTNLSSS